MTTSELIAELQRLDPDGDGEVHISYDYGDYWHTPVAPKIERVQVAFVQRSDYHGMDKIADEEDGESSSVVVLST